MRKTITIQSTLLGGLAVLLLAACSGAEPIDSASASQGIAPDNATPCAADQAAPPHHDPAKFLERFDKDKNGTVELTELPDRMRDKLAKADSNGDGKISIEELKAKFEAHRGKRFAKMDTNGDGAISKDEVPAERWEHLAKADADGNGSVTKAEIEQAFKDGKLEMPRHGRGAFGKDHGFRPDPAKMIARFDRDGNGTLELTELPERMQKRLADADSNKDGKLSLDELKAHIESHRPPEPPPASKPQQ